MLQIEEFIPILKNKNYVRKAQIHSIANYWRKRTKKDGEIDWRMSAQSIYNLIRSLSYPYVGAHFKKDGETIKVWKSKMIENNSLNIEPGKIINVASGYPVIKAGENAIKLLKFSPDVKFTKDSYL